MGVLSRVQVQFGRLSFKAGGRRSDAAQHIVELPRTLTGSGFFFAPTPHRLTPWLASCPKTLAQHRRPAVKCSGLATEGLHWSEATPA